LLPFPSITFPFSAVFAKLPNAFPLLFPAFRFRNHLADLLSNALRLKSVFSNALFESEALLFCFFPILRMPFEKLFIPHFFDM